MDRTSIFTNGYYVDSINFKVSRAELEFFDDSSGTFFQTLSKGQDITVTIDGTTRYRGVVVDYDITEEGMVTVYSIDYSNQFHNKIITLYDANGQTASQIVADLNTTYGGGLFTTNIASTSKTYDIIWRMATPLEIMQELALAESHIIKVTPSLVLTFQPESYNDTGKSYSEGTDILVRKFPKIGNKIINSIILVGRGATPETAGNVYIKKDPVSIALYGEKQEMVEDPDVTNAAQARLKLDALLKEYANPLVLGSITIDQDYTLASGDLIRITDTKVGWTNKQVLILETYQDLDVPVTELQLVNTGNEVEEALSKLIESRRVIQKRFKDDAVVPANLLDIYVNLNVTFTVTISKASIGAGIIWDETEWDVTDNSSVWDPSTDTFSNVTGPTNIYMTTAGLQRVRDLIQGNAVTDLSASNVHIALGDGTTSFTIDDTALANEIIRLAMDPGYPQDGSNAGEAEFQVSIDDTNVVSDTFQEVGVFDNSTGGTLISRGVLSSSFTKSQNEIYKVYVLCSLAEG